MRLRMLASSRFSSLLRSHKNATCTSPMARMDAVANTVAVAASAQRKGFACPCDAEALELAMLEWLSRHHDDATIGHTRGDMGHVELLSDKWTAAEINGVTVCNVTVCNVTISVTTVDLPIPTVLPCPVEICH